MAGSPSCASRWRTASGRGFPWPRPAALARRVAAAGARGQPMPARCPRRPLSCGDRRCRRRRCAPGPLRQTHARPGPLPGDRCDDASRNQGVPSRSRPSRAWPGGCIARRGEEAAKEPIAELVATAAGRDVPAWATRSGPKTGRTGPDASASWRLSRYRVPRPSGNPAGEAMAARQSRHGPPAALPANLPVSIPSATRVLPASRRRNGPA